MQNDCVSEAVPKDQLVFLDQLNGTRSVICQHNERLISPHDIRVSELGSTVAIVMGLSRYEVIKVSEGGLIHDIGKRFPAAQAWLDKHRGLRNLPEDELQKFRQLHCRMGVVMLARFNRHRVISSESELKDICLRHHDPALSFEGLPSAKILSVIQLADSFDAMTSGEGDHTYACYNKAEAIHSIHNLCGNGYYNLEAVQALAACFKVALK